MENRLAGTLARLVVTQVYIEKMFIKNLEIGFQSAVFHLCQQVLVLLLCSDRGTLAIAAMHMELPHFNNGEHNSESASTLDRDITPLIIYSSCSSDNTGWEKRFVLLEDQTLSFHLTDDTSVKPIDHFDLCPNPGSVNLISDVK